jgi:hypothetical protein
VHARLTGRRGVLMTAPAPQPQPVPPAVADLVNPDLTPPSLAGQVNHLTAMHHPEHPHMTGSVQPDLPALNPAEHIPLPNNMSGPHDAEPP